MALTNFDSASLGAKPLQPFAKALTGTLVAGRPFNPMYLAGVPSPASAPSGGAAGTALTSLTGQIPVPAASNNTHLHSMNMTSSAQGGLVLLCDRLWHNSGLSMTLTTAQAVNSATWPSRDNDGATLGQGVLLGVEIVTATGAGVPTITVNYTNQAGTAGKTATNTVPTVASSAAGTFYPIGLAAGDTGVQSVQSLTLSATWTSGAMSLVAYRVLASLPLVGAGIPNSIDPLTGGLPRLYDNSVPFILFYPQTTTTTQLSGSAIFTQG